MYSSIVLKDKTEELNQLHKRIDQIFSNFHKEHISNKLDLKCFTCDPTLDEISSKKFAICVIGQSYEAKVSLVNAIFALKNKNVLEPTSPTKLSRRNSNPDYMFNKKGQPKHETKSPENEYFDLPKLFGEPESKIRYDSEA